jgi:hypothetical protein
VSAVDLICPENGTPEISLLTCRFDVYILLSLSFFTEKTHTSKVSRHWGSKHSISPDSASANEELILLRAKNMALTEALATVKASADMELKKKFDLVWFARYRCKSFSPLAVFHCYTMGSLTLSLSTH